MPTICEPWPVTWACDITCLAPAVTGTALQVASEIIWSLSGRQFGYCTRKLRPCRRTCSGGWFSDDYQYPRPALIDGLWYNLTCGTCGDSCSCTELSEVDLGGQVAEIVSVVIDDTPLVTGAYRVDNNRYLVRIDGGRFPYCNDLSKSSGTGTWSVTAKYGTPVPESGKMAVGELACELAKALNGETCKLPRAVQSVARQGVTLNFQSVIDLMDKGMIGLTLVDYFVRTYNPNRLTSGATIINIDKPQPRITTWGPA